MSQQKDLLREIAAATSSGASDRISDWFTEDFRLHEPGKPALPVGHQGARQMREAGRQMRAGLKTPICAETVITWGVCYKSRAIPPLRVNCQAHAKRSQDAHRGATNRSRRAVP